MKIHVLASGSKGNAIIINHKENFLALDLGISNKAYLKKLQQLNISSQQIKALIITHEHKDHISGAYLFAKNNPQLKIYMSEGTYQGSSCFQYQINNYEKIQGEQTYQINGFKVLTINNSHDAREPLGIIVEIAGQKIVYITDTGYIHTKYDNILKGAHVYLIEANHDIGLLMNTNKRPYTTKMRIISEHGHMNNNYITKKINEYLTPSHKAIWCVMHISEDCNSIDAIEREICNNINDLDNIEIFYSSQKITSIELKE